MGEETASVGKGKRALMVLGFIVLALLLFAASIRVFIPPVAPDRAAPAGHFQGDCVICHLVIEDAETTDAGN